MLGSSSSRAVSILKGGRCLLQPKHSHPLLKTLCNAPSTLYCVGRVCTWLQTLARPLQKKQQFYSLCNESKCNPEQPLLLIISSHLNNYYSMESVPCLEILVGGPPAAHIPRLLSYFVLNFYPYFYFACSQLLRRISIC